MRYGKSQTIKNNEIQSKKKVTTSVLVITRTIAKYS